MAKIITKITLSFPGPDPSRPEPSLGRTQFRELLETAIADLTPDFRLPFLMHEVEGMSISTIAYLLQINGCRQKVTGCGDSLASMKRMIAARNGVRAAS